MTTNSLQSKLNPSISAAKQLSRQIQTALHWDIVYDLQRKLGDTGYDDYWKNILEGECLKVEKDVLPKYYELCYEVVSKLGNINVEFYVSSEIDINAKSFSMENTNEPAIVVLNASLLNLLNDNELKFAIGHELGHLINKDTQLKRLISFVFPKGEYPPALEKKILLYYQLAELVADRYGFLACGDFNASVSTFYKLKSGLNLTEMNVNIDAFLKDNDQRLDYFINGNGVCNDVHPASPIRVEALRLFANCQSEEELEKSIYSLVYSTLMKEEFYPFNEYVSLFKASAGLLIACVDKDKKNLSDYEIDSILTSLSYNKTFVSDYLNEVYEKGNWEDLLSVSSQKLLEMNPEVDCELLEYMIKIALADSHIDQREVDMVYQFGEKYLDLEEKEIAERLAEYIKDHFVPNMDSIS